MTAGGSSVSVSRAAILRPLRLQQRKDRNLVGNVSVGPLPEVRVVDDGAGRLVRLVHFADAPSRADSGKLVQRMHLQRHSRSPLNVRSLYFNLTDRREEEIG